jgi:LPS-assembly lipoprotein
MVTRRHLLARLLPATLAIAPALAGCGWEPLYADPQTGAASADLRAIKVMPIGDRIGQQLEFALRNAFNPDGVPTKERYVLQVTLNILLQDLGIQSQGLGSRGEVHLIANYQLSEIGTGKLLQNGGMHASDSFDIQANGYSTVVAQNDAKTRTVEEVRREIVARLTLFMQNQAPAKS